MSLETMHSPVPVVTSLREDNLQSISNGMRTDIFRWLMETRKEKFKDFLWWLQKFRYAVCSCMRGNLMEHYYCVLRFIDDVADGDHPLPGGHETRPGYVEQRLAFARDTSTPKDAIDQVLQHCYHLAEQLGFSLHSETILMLESILFDAERRGKNIVFPKNILKQNFFALDIDGTISASLKIFGEDAELCSELSALGNASRVQYNIQDLRTDIDRDGLINISEEDMQELGMTQADLRDPKSPAFQAWLQQEAQRGMMLLDRHDKTMKTLKVGRVTTFTLKNVYRNPARKCFEGVIARQEY